MRHTLFLLFAVTLSGIVNATYIHTLIINDDLGNLKGYLKEHPENVNQPGYDGKTPLIWAAWNGKLAIVEYLLSLENIEVDAEENFKYTALGLACTQKYEETPKIVTMLLEHKADPNHANKSGRTPLRFAVEYNHSLIPLLLEAGADYIPLLDYAKEGHVARPMLIDFHKKKQMEKFPLCADCHRSFEQVCSHGVELSLDSVLKALTKYMGSLEAHKADQVQRIINAHYTMLGNISINDYRFLLVQYLDKYSLHYFANQGVDPEALQELFFTAGNFYCDSQELANQ